MNFIEKLQNKPRYIRIQILWISVILVMFIIISIWLTRLGSTLNSIGANQKPQIEEQKQSIPSLFGTIKEDFSLLKKSLETGFEQIIGKEEAGEQKFEVEILNP